MTIICLYKVFDFIQILEKAFSSGKCFCMEYGDSLELSIHEKGLK